jgi:hypothetical protein
MADGDLVQRRVRDTAAGYGTAVGGAFADQPLSRGRRNSHLASDEVPIVSWTERGCGPAPFWSLCHLVGCTAPSSLSAWRTAQPKPFQ